MKEIITISGLPGSGKSTIADRVADELGWNRFSSGDFMREMAHERGLTLAELSAQAESDPAIDKLIDAKNKGLAAASQVVIDSRLAFHFIPESFSVYLDVDADEAARRIWQDDHETRQKAGEMHDSVALTKEQMLARIDSERTRYQELYQLDYTDHSHYKLIVDTTDKGITEIVQAVLTAYTTTKNRP